MDCVSCSLISYVMGADKHGKEFVQKAVDVSRPRKKVSHVGIFSLVLASTEQ